MDSLEKAVQLVSQWPAGRQKQRDEIGARVDALVRTCEDAAKVWQDYARAPGAPGDRFALLSWVGADRARKLFDIHLVARKEAQKLCDLAGPPAGRLSGLDEDVVEMAYRQLGDGETGPQAAEVALSRLRARVDYLNGLKRRMVAAPKVKAPGKSAKPAPAKKRTSTRAGKKPARKKASPKKPAKKKK